ncbi:MAG: hypothetical protein IJU64_02125 [Bacilli bacterium]|nr:hypothetical protein [Bacilli bacterium]
MELILLIVVSILIARYLERTQYRIAMMAHAVLFVVLWVFYFFGSELPLFVSLGKTWLGQDIYSSLHAAITSNYGGISLGFSSFFFVEILVLVSFAGVLTVGVIRSYKRIAKLIRLRAGWGFLRSDLPVVTYENTGVGTFGPMGKTYLVLGRLRN